MDLGKYILSARGLVWVISKRLWVVALVAVLLAGVAVDRSVPQTSSPFAGEKFYVDPDSDAKKQADAWRSSRPEDAAQMDKIASQPTAHWLGDTSPQQVFGYTDGLVTKTTDAGALPVLVAYNIPNRDCGSYSSGGARSAQEYRAWVRALARGIGEREAVVILEPDALADAGCLTAYKRKERVELIKDAVYILEAKPGVSVYLDGRHAWDVTPQERAQQLKEAGIERARGFVLNVSGFFTTEDMISDGKAISSFLGDKPFVIDTSRNGLGAADHYSDPEWWCNPEGRALGERPTAETGDPLVDAYYWVKTPGESDGTCHDGPPSGQWWPEYALGLAQRAAY